jgi:cholesterol transport system auxiliary component
MRKSLAGIAASLPMVLAGCGGVFESKIAAPQAYVLRLPPNTAPATGTTSGSIRVQRPEAGPGLATERIALLRSDRRFDFYAASRWAAPAPDIVEAVVLDALRGTGVFSAVFDDASPYAPRYDLRITLRRFEADYTAEGSGPGGSAPTVYVVLDCTLGRNRDRALLASFTAQGSARADQDRLNSVVAAFEAATTTAMSELARATAAGIASSESAAAAPPASN